VTTTLNMDQARTLMGYACDLGLSQGIGEPTPGLACAEHLKNILAGTPQNKDAPLPCVSGYDNRLAIRANDRPGWTSNVDRGRGMARILVMQLGTVGTDRMPMKLALQAEIIRNVVPIALRAARRRNTGEAEEIEALAVRCENEGTREAALAASAAMREIARVKWAAAADAADAAAADAADAAAAAADAADAAARIKARRDVLLVWIGCIERAYEATGSPGVDMLREIEASR
jgi:hypothetical protein